MASNCINRNLQEFKNIAKAVNKPEAVIAAEITVWQNKNGVEKFPTIEELYPSLKDFVQDKQFQKLTQEEKVKQSAEIESTMETIYTKVDASEKYIKGLEENTEDTIASVEAKIEHMRKVFGPDVVVILDTNLEASGALLGANNPISKQYPNKVVIAINPNKVFKDTVLHEFGHLYIDLLGGMSDPKVQDGVELLKGTKLWEEIEKAYPELSPDMLAKEVLATALGLDATEIYDKKDNRRTLWQQFKAFIFNILSGKIFKNKLSPNALEQLASELVTGNLRINKNASYNTTIDQFSKYTLSKNTPEEIDKLFKHFNEILEVVEDKEMGVRYYNNKETNTKYNNSVSETASSIANKFSSTRKGVRSLSFDGAFMLTKENFESILNQPQIPWALDRALQDAFDGEFSNSSFKRYTEMPPNTYWYNHYLKINTDPENLIVDEGKKTIKENLDFINEKAAEYETQIQTPLIAGNIVHNALENYVQERIERLSKGDDTKPTLPPEVIIALDNEEEISPLEKIDAIIVRGIKEGSTFYTEQKLFSEIAKRPGTADLIEITKDGKHRIYDYKTTSSFTNRSGNTKSDIVLFGGEYLAQILIYSTILQEYGIPPANDSLNILSMEITTDTVEDKMQVNIVDSKFKTIDPEDYDFSRKIKQYNNNIITIFKNPSKLTEFNFEDVTDTLNSLVNKIERAVKDYDKLTRASSGKYTTNTLKQQNRIIADIERSLEDLSAAKNSTAVLSYIKNVKDALHSVFNKMLEDNNELNPEFLENVRFLLQVTSFTDDVKTFLKDKEIDFSIRNYNRDALLDMIKEIEEVTLQVNKLLIEKRKEFTIHTLAANSSLMKGFYTEKFEKEAIEIYNKQNRKTNKVSFIKEYVFNKIQEKDAEITKKEYDYWTNIMRNGYTDIRFMEYMLADPGMNKSQLVQIVKNIMDKTDLDTRIDTDNSIRDLTNWYDNLKINKTGNPKKVWGKYAIDSTYVDDTGKEITYKTGILISEKTSDYREAIVKFKLEEADYERRIFNAKLKNLSTEAQRLIKEKEEKRNLFRKSIRKLSKASRIHPEFAKLSKEEKDVLRYIHNKLKKADERVDRKADKLVTEVRGGTYIYELPKVRMSTHEAMYDATNLVDRTMSNLKDMVRPPADEDDIIIDVKNKNGDNLTTSTDILGEPLYEIPVFFRRELEDPQLQSFDIPTLLAMNEETTISYSNYKLVEADLNVIVNTLKDVPVHKTDSVINKAIAHVSPDGLSKHLKSNRNLVLEAINASIENRLYKRTYRGIYSKTNYRLIRLGEALNKNTGIILLAGNFKSATITALQGTIYRLVEGIAQEDFNTKDVAIGSKKAWLDIHNIITDSQSIFPSSKTNLLIRRFGLDTQYQALVNKFVQSNFATKNLDKDSLYAITGIAEKIVTATLMYTLMNNIKVLNKDGKFINKDGKVVDRKDAMSLDEAYTVKEGKLVLHPSVSYTDRNLSKEYRNNLYGEKTTPATEISRFIRSKYADLYGQYSPDMKSVAEMHIVGKMVFSMRKWLPRGVHRRWRGITSVGNTFEEMALEDRIEERFYSQDQQKFQEGYYVTTLRYFYSIYMLSKRKQLGLMTAAKDINNKLTIHERANLIRTTSEVVIMMLTAAAALLLRAIALNSGDDDKEKERLYFIAYLMERINTESATFVNVGEAIDILRNPAASVNVLTKITDLFVRIVGFSFSEEGEFTWNIFEEYEKGNRKGELKVIKEIEGLTPFYKHYQHLKGIFGFENKSTIEDSYKYLIRH